MKFAVISVMPAMFEAMKYGVTGRAITNKLVDLTVINPRDFATNSHKQIDDRPYGGGPGMVMMAKPLEAAIIHAKKQLGEARIIYLSPQGKTVKQSDLCDAAKQQKPLAFIAGRYEGIDERIINTVCDEEWSVGDVVLSGGELAAMMVIDGITRLIPGALGHHASATSDSFMNGLLDCPHYTRPEDFNGQKVPQVLLRGDHKAIERWRLKQALGNTWLKRPDLILQRQLTELERELLNEFKSELRSTP